MAIEKGLYGMPEGIEGELMGEEMAPDAMVEMAIATDEDMPIMIELEDGSVEISFGKSRIAQTWRLLMRTSLST